MANLQVNNVVTYPPLQNWPTHKAFSVNGLTGQNTRMFLRVYKGGTIWNFPACYPAYATANYKKIGFKANNQTWSVIRMSESTASNSASGAGAGYAGQKYLTNYSTGSSYKVMSVASALSTWNVATNTKYTITHTMKYTNSYTSQINGYIYGTNSTAGWTTNGGITNASSSKSFLMSTKTSFPANTIVQASKNCALSSEGVHGLMYVTSLRTAANNGFVANENSSSQHYVHAGTGTRYVKAGSSANKQSVMSNNVTATLSNISNTNATLTSTGKRTHTTYLSRRIVSVSGTIGSNISTYNAIHFRKTSHTGQRGASAQTSVILYSQASTTRYTSYHTTVWMY